MDKDKVLLISLGYEIEQLKNGPQNELIKNYTASREKIYQEVYDRIYGSNIESDDNNLFIN